MANPTKVIKLRDLWETKDEEAEALIEEFQLNWDAAADSINHKLPYWFGPGAIYEDTLTADWFEVISYALGCRPRLLLNPPYTLNDELIRKAALEARKGCLVVGVFHNSPCSSAWCDEIWDDSLERPKPGITVRNRRGRMPFTPPVMEMTGNPDIFLAPGIEESSPRHETTTVVFDHNRTYRYGILAADATLRVLQL